MSAPEAHTLVITGSDLPAAHAVAREAEHRGMRVFVKPALTEEGIDAAFDQVTEQISTIHAVVHLVGAGSKAGLLDTQPREWDAAIDENLTSAFCTARRAIRELLSQGGGGRLVFAGPAVGEAEGDGLITAATRAGLRGLTRTIAKEYGRRGIYANLVAPTLRNAEPGAELAFATSILFLASERASFVNGEVLHVFGEPKDRVF